MGGVGATPWKAGKKRVRDKEWEELGRKVEHKVMREVRSWAEQDDGAQKEAASAKTSATAECDEEWKEIGRLVEQKIKRKVRKWAEED